MSQVNSPTAGPVQGPRQSHTNILQSQPERRLSVESDHGVGGVGSFTTSAVDTLSFAQLNVRSVNSPNGSVEGFPNAEVLDSDLHTPQTTRRWSATMEDLSQAFTDLHSPEDDQREEGKDQLSPLRATAGTGILKKGQRLSLDSNAGLSPDVVNIKHSLREQATPGVHVWNMRKDVSPEILKTASKILKEREAGHAAEKQRLRSDLAQLREAISGLEIEKRELLREKSRLETSIADYGARLELLSGQIKEGNTKLQALQKKYDKTKEILSGQVSVLTSQVQGKQQEKFELEQSVAALKAERLFLEQAKNTETERLESLYHEKIQTLELSIQSLQSQLAVAQEEAAKQKEIVAEVSLKQSKTATTNKELESENKELKLKVRGLTISESNANAKVEALESKLLEKDRLVQQLLQMIQTNGEGAVDDTFEAFSLTNPVQPRLKFAENTVAEDKHTAGKVGKRIAFGDHEVKVLEETAHVDDTMSFSVTEDVAVQNVTTTSFNPRRDSLESVQSNSERTTIEQRRAEKAEKELLETTQKKAARAAKRAASNK